MDLSGLCVVESDAVSAAEPNPVIAVHIAVADIDRCLGQFIYSVEHIVFLVVLKNAAGFSIVPVYAFVGEEPHVTYRILLNVEDSAVAQSVFHPYVFICLRRSYERQKE